MQGYETEALNRALPEEFQQQCSYGIDHTDEPALQ